MIALAFWLVASAATQTSGTEEPVWRWDGETPICRLRQQTPSGDKIEISRTPGNEQTEFKIYLQPGSKIREGRFQEGTLTLDSSSETLDVSIYQARDGLMTVYAVSQDPTFMRRFSHAAKVEVSHQSIGTFQESLLAAAAASDALQSCEDQKLRDWGIDPIAWRSLLSRPVPLKPISQQFNSLDYPLAALTAGIEADAVTRLDVDSNGRVVRCKSPNAGSYKGFEEAACDVLKNARFRPATDPTGNPVPAPYVYDVKFRIAR